MTQKIRDALLAGWVGHIELPLSERILDAGRLQSFGADEAIARLGEEQHYLHGIVSGTVRMFVTMNEQPPKFAHICGPGFWFGDHEILTGGPRIMEIEAGEETTVFNLPRHSIDAIANDGFDIWKALYMLAVMNQGTAIGAADDLMIRNSRKRLAAVILRLSSNRSAYQGVRPIDKILATWDDIAEVASLSRSNTAALLGEFSRDGLIQTERKTIIIKDPNGLERLLES